MNKLLNGFNNGRDTTDGVGGEYPSVFENYDGLWFTEIPGAFKIDWRENMSKPEEFITIQVPIGSFIATRNDSKKESLAKFIDWLLES